MGFLDRRPDIDGRPEPGQWKWIRPTSVRWHHRNFNEKAVKFYERKPNGRWDGSSGDPYVAADGTLYNGVHRAEAARRQGRNLYAYVADPKPQKKGWW